MKTRNMSLEQVSAAFNYGSLTIREWNRYWRSWIWSAARFSEPAASMQDRFAERWGMEALYARRSRVMRALRAVGEA